MSYNGVGLNVQSVLVAVCSLTSIIAFLLVGTRLMRRRLMSVGLPSTRALRLCETLPLDPKRRIHLLECEGSKVLVMTGGGSDQVIGWVQPK
jgi:flagellar biogenesis protein FliO